MRPSLAACLLILAACAPSPSPRPTISIPAGAPAAPEAPVAEGPEALVWTAAEGHPPSTRWLAPTAGGYRRVAETSGLLIASGPDVWRWSAREEPYKTEACDGLPTVVPPGKGSLTRVFLERVGGSERVEIVSPKEERVVNDIKHSATPVGSIGPYLFVRERTDWFACAHSLVDVGQSVWDVSQRARVDLLSPEERKVVDTTDHAAAVRLFKRQEGTYLSSVQDPDYVASVPRYQAHGWLSIEHVFTHPSSRAANDRVWSSFTRSVHVPASQIPAKAQPFVKPPPAVSAYLADHPEAKISGWSTVSKDAAAVLAGALGGR
jgi:hypothetical protein